MQIADGAGFVKIYDNHIEIEREPPPPPPEPHRFETERMKSKREMEMEGGAAAIQRHLGRIAWAKEFNEKRQKLASELASEAKEAAAKGFNTSLELNPGNLPISNHTTEGNVKAMPHPSKAVKG